MSRNQNRRKRTKKKKSRKIWILFIIVGLLGGIVGAYGFSILDKIQQQDISLNDEDLGIRLESNKNDNIINIALFGLDRREATGNSRSDTVMIASIDKEHDKIKLTSLMRDTYLEIPGRGMDKLTHAYAFGGPELAIKTINHNYDMNIRDYITVDFFGLEEIIDTIGGVEVELTTNEVAALNKSLMNMNELTGTNSPTVQNAGLQNLNGRQAVSYARIRKIGNGDYERTNRQRLILEEIFNKTLDAGVTKYPKLLNTMFPYIKTSLSKASILSMGTSIITSGIRDIEQYRLPVDGYVENEFINGVSYVVPKSLEENVNLLNQFIYEDIRITQRED